MRALVTGAGGFLGSYICRLLLARGVTVRGYGRHDYPSLRELGVELIRGDIRDGPRLTEACRGVDVVFHTAALAGIWGRWKDYLDVNVNGTEQVLTACRAASVPLLVHTSSPSVTFEARDQCGVDESAPYARRWLCHYPRSKALAEQLVLAAHGPQLATCALRPHLIWGPDDPHLVPRLLSRARQGKLKRIGDGRNRIDMVYVENAAEAHWLAAEALNSGRAGGTAYFISQGEPVFCWEWIDRLLALAGMPPLQASVSFPAAWAAGWLCERLYSALSRREDPPMTRFLAAQLAKSHFFDISRARHELGYCPTISTEEGMRRLAKWLAKR